MDPRERGLIQAFNVGTAAFTLPKGLYNFVNIVDKNDPVVRLTGGAMLNEQPYALEHPDTYKLIRTDINAVLGRSTPENPHNSHSLYLYAQTPEFQKALEFGDRAKSMILTRPFDPWD
jgi:hypothetical protein